MIQYNTVKFSLYNQKELNFVELNITGTEDEYKQCDENSKFLDCVVFNLFTECFEKANNLYEYYQPTRYNTRCIVPLRNRLMTNLTELEQIKSLHEFQSFISGKILGKGFLIALVRSDRNWTDHWRQYDRKLLAVNKEILDLIDFCINEDRILWVIGY